MMPKKLKVLMVAPEVTPIIKVGGLADVVGALSKALVEQGHDVRIVMPKYAGMKHIDTAKAEERPLVVRLGGHESYARVWTTTLPDSKAILYLLEHNQFFDARSVYTGPSGNEDDNGQRFTFFSRAAIDLTTYLDWIPDVIHCHDWATGLTPVYLNTTELHNPIGRAASVLTLHNMEHQGWFHRNIIEYAGLPDSVFRPDGLESMGEANMLKGGMYHSTKITTVSPTYAKEVQTPDGGGGLHHVLSFRQNDLFGVINGIDESEWNPKIDTLIPANFTAKNLKGKGICKKALQEAYGLEVRPDVPVFAVVSRLANQKGLDLLAAIGDRLMADMQIQVAVLGTGEPSLEHAFRELAQRYPGRFGAQLLFSNELAHLTTAGADFFVMPSRFEPCGLGQLYAMTYGTLPVVRATGGLIDTVEKYSEHCRTGTGFVFDFPTEDGLYYTIGWACSTYYDRPEDLAVLRKNAMQQSFSWDTPAKKYVEIYKEALEARRVSFVAK
ncbi:MAG: glycogen synthase GlgA [Opitutaceae bacterium]